MVFKRPSPEVEMKYQLARILRTLSRPWTTDSRCTLHTINIVTFHERSDARSCTFARYVIVRVATLVVGEQAGYDWGHCPHRGDSQRWAAHSGRLRCGVRRRVQDAVVGVAIVDYNGGANSVENATECSIFI